MASTHLSLHYHIVFSTKERRLFIHSEWQGKLHSFLGGCIRTEGGMPFAVGGVADHVHLLVGLKATHRLADVVKNTKVASTKWVHSTFGHKVFCWQTGYGAFTVSRSQLAIVRRYIEQQAIHHKRMTFKREYLELLRRSEVSYDERYMW